MFGVLTAGLSNTQAAPANLPQSPDIRHGDISITTHQKNMDVDQSTHYGIIDWQSFSIGNNHSVHFDNGVGATLNRVTGVDVSHIYGSLTSTGDVYLLNSNGIIVGEGGEILTGGNFVGSTLNMSNADFLNGGGFSLQGTTTAGFTNLGKISSSGGNVLLSGYTVTNQGTIEAPNGIAGLAAGKQIDVLTDLSWGRGSYAVKVGERGNDITNEGVIKGLVAELRTHNGNIFALAGNNDGLIHATGVDNEGGRVFLTATNGLIQSSGEIRAEVDDRGGNINLRAALVQNYGGVQDVSGTSGGAIRIDTRSIISDTTMLALGDAGNGGRIIVNADGQSLFTSAGLIAVDGIDDGGEVILNAGEGRLIMSGLVSAAGQMEGGRISLWGDHVALMGGTLIADGGPMGGEIYLGGGYQGESIWPSGQAPLPVQNAARTYVSENSLLSADAGLLGKGGTVVAWSDGTTEFNGMINARGGLLGGDGGLVETSGLEGLGALGIVDASARAPYGENGSWLLDPDFIVIEDTTDPFTEFTRISESTEGFGIATDRNPDDNLGARFGSSIDVLGNTMVVGVRGFFDRAFTYPSVNNDGAVYVFKNGRIAARLHLDSDSLAFGENVALTTSNSGDGTVLVGATEFYSFPIFREGTGWRNGTANLVRQDTITGGGFLYRLAADGGRFFVGDPNYDITGFSNAGAVHVFTEFGPGGTITPNNLGVTNPDFLNALDNAGFGYHIAAADGWLFAGFDPFHSQWQRTYYASDLNTGATATPTLSATVSEHPSSSNGFTTANGRLITVNRDFVRVVDHETIVGEVNLVLNFTLALNNNAFGGSLRDIDYDGSSLIYAMGGATDADGTHDQVGFYSFGSGFDSSIRFPDNSVKSVAISGDYAAVGLPEVAPPGESDRSIGSAYFLQKNEPGSSDWRDGAALTHVGPARADEGFTFGEQSAVDGNTIVIADDNAANVLFDVSEFYGNVYVYEDEQLAAVLEPGLNVTSRAFGQWLDVSGDTIVTTSVSGSGPSQLHVFEKGAGWMNGTANRTALATQQSGIYFEGVAIDNDVIVAAARYNSTGIGRVDLLLYEKGNDPWSTVFFNTTQNVDNVTVVRPEGAINSAPLGLVFDGDTAVVQLNGSGNDANKFTVVEYNSNSWADAAEVSVFVHPDNLSNHEFGRGFDVSGDTLTATGHDVTGYAVFVYERETDWASVSDTPVARLRSNVGGVRTAVAVDDDLIATATNSRVVFFEKGNGWTDDLGNLTAFFDAGVTSGLRGQPGSIDLSGDIFVAGLHTSQDDSPLSRQALVLKGPFDLTNKNTFASNFGNTTNIAASTIGESLSRGTDVTLQANSDITLRSAITVDNTEGDGGHLTLQAGRSLLVLDDIFTDNGDLTLSANDPAADQARRASGEGVFVIGEDQSGDDAIINFGTGTLLINGGDRFENRSSTTDPFVFDAEGGGRYIVYSSRPDGEGAPDQANLSKDVNITGRDFIVYNKSYDPDNPIAGLPDGSGFVYTVAPELSVNVGNDSITFGETATAELSLAGATVNGQALDAQGLIDFGLTTADLSALVDTGLANNVTTSAGGFADAGFWAQGITAQAKSEVTTGDLFGIGVTTGVAGDLTVAKAQLAGDVDNLVRQYGTADEITVSYTGFVTGDDASVLDTGPTLASSQAINADADQTYVGALTATGAADDNYNITYSAGDLTVVKKDIEVTGLSGTDRVYDATDDAGFTGTATIDVLAGDDITLGGTLTATGTFADKHIGTDKAITVTGYVINGADANNYNLIQPTGLTADVTALALTIEGLTAEDRVYDATTDVVLNSTAAVTALAADLISLDGTATGNFDNKHVGVDKAVTLSGLSLSGTDAGNYTLVLEDALVATVSTLDLQITGVTADDRVYDAKTVATLSGTAAVDEIDGDAISLGGSASASFADKHVGTDKAVTVIGYALSGADSGNYNLLQPVGLTADISQLDIEVGGVAANDRVYDATAVATLTGGASVAALAEDDLAVAGTAAAVFADKHVGAAKAVTVTGYTLAGDDALNYNVIQPQGLTADVTARPLTVEDFVANDKVYDATTDATATGTASFGGILGDDDAIIDATGFTFSFADKHAGEDKAIVFDGIELTGTDATNYDTTAIDGFTATVTQASAFVSDVTAADRQYDATVDAVLSGGTLNGIIGDDTVTLNVTTAGVFNDKNIGVDKAVTTDGFSLSGADALNYDLTQPVGLLATITAAPLTIVDINGDRIYDGTTDAPLNNNGFDAVFDGDVVSLDESGITSFFADKNVGEDKAITITGDFGLSGTDAGNYVLAQPAEVVGTIAKKGITVEGLTIATKIYDGNAVGEISGTGTFGGLIEGDDVAIAVGEVDIEFADKHVGVDKDVALSGITLSGSDAGNYDAATPTGITGTITAKDLFVTGISADDKVYDRATVASLTGTGALDGVIAGDDVTLDENARMGAFDDKNVGVDKTVTVNDLAVTGDDAGNYNLVAPTDLATITPADVIIIGLSGDIRVYDATTDAPIIGDASLDFGDLNGVLAGSEDVALDGEAIGLYADKHIGTDKAIEVSGYTLIGVDQDNYNLVLPTDLTGEVTQLAVTITGIAASDRAYDGTNIATFDGEAVIGSFTGDDVVIEGGDEILFDDKNVGTEKPVTVNEFTLTGEDADNYALTQPEGFTATITQAELTVTGINADNKTYDGTTSAPLSGSPIFGTFFDDEVILVEQIVANFDDKNAGQDKAVTIEGIEIGGADAANYIVAIPELNADINPMQITVTGIAANDKVYDGTTLATLSGNAVLNNLAGDDVAFDAGALESNFVDRNVDTDILVRLLGTGLSGEDAGNYTLLLPFNLRADITPLAITVVGAEAEDRDYDQTIDVAVSGGDIPDAISGDDVNLADANASGELANADAGANKAVTVEGYALTGDDAGNYTLVQPIDVTVDIAKKLLDVTGLEIVEKFFDGNTDAEFSGGQLTGFFQGDSVNLVTENAEASFFDAEVGTDKPVLVAGLSLRGAQAANYTIGTLLVTGNLLTEIQDITDVVPSEVLRATSEQLIAQQRMELEALTAEQEYARFVDLAPLALPNNVASPNVITALTSIPPDQRDAVTQAYVDAANKALQTKQSHDQVIAALNANIRVHKELGAEYNNTQRAIAVETALLDDLAAEAARVDTELAVVEENLAAIGEARRRITEYEQKIEQATRLGRGAAVAEYEQIIADAQAIVDQEADVLQQKAELEVLAAESRQRLEDSEQKIADMQARSEDILVEMKTAEERVESNRASAAQTEKDAELAKAELEQARAAGEAAYAQRTSNLVESRQQAQAQLNAVSEVANSDLAQKTAENIYDQDLGVIAAKAATRQASETVDKLGSAIEQSLGSGSLRLAQQLAEQATSEEGITMSQDDMRNYLVSSNLELLELEEDYKSAVAEQEALMNNALQVISQNTSNVQLMIQGGPQNAFNTQIAQMSGVNLDNVPTIDADGNPISEIERLAIGMLQNKFDEDTAAGSYNKRVADKVLGEFGLQTDEVLDDPSLLVDEAIDRVPTDKDGAVDLATDVAAARIRLSGVLKDSAKLEAEAQDPTGTVKSINDIERAARDEFAATYGKQPEELLIDYINQKAQGVKDADSPEEMLELYMQQGTPAQAMMAKEALEGLANGESPEDIIAGIKSSQGAAGMNTNPADAAETALAMEAAAMAQAEEADRTGALAASNRVKGAADAEFAKAFGGSPEELAIDAMRDPEAAVGKVLDVGKNIFTTSDGGVAAVKDVGSAAVNMASAQTQAAFNEMSRAAEKLGGMGKAVAAVADFAGDVVGEVGSWFGADNGPSADEIAFMEAQTAHAAAQFEQRKQQAVAEYLAAAQKIAEAKYKLAVGVENAKQQVSTYVLSAKVESELQQEEARTVQATRIAITDYVQSELDENVKTAQQGVDVLSESPEQLAAKAGLWKSGG